MEEFIGALLSALAELLFEALLQIVLAVVADLLTRTLRNPVAEGQAVSPILAGAVYFLIGSALGATSLYFFPHPIFHPSRFHGISLIVSPVIAGLAMAQVGGLVRRTGSQSVQIESFGYGCAFALGMAIIRLLFVR